MPGVNSRHWDSIIDALAEAPIVDPSGLATPKLMAITGHDSTNALAKLLRRMETAGVIERDINGRRTTRIALTSKGQQLAGLPVPARVTAPVADAETEMLRRRVAMLEEMVEMLLDRLGRAA